MSRIIGISGRIGSGKDTVASIIQHLQPGENWEVKKYAGKLKQIASILTGIDVDKFEDQEFKKSLMPAQWSTVTIETGDNHFRAEYNPVTVRQFLQRLGTEGLRTGLHEDVWINALFADLKKDSNWLITDVRFPNEYDAIKARGGKVIRVEREAITSSNLHPSETSLDHHEFDYKIANCGSLDELKKSIEIMFDYWDMAQYY